MPESWKLLELRARVSRVDTQLVALLAERFAIARDIQRLKQVLQLPVEDTRRETAVLRQVRSLAADFGVDEALVTCIWLQLFDVAKSTLTVVKEEQRADSQNSPQCRRAGSGEVCDD